MNVGVIGAGSWGIALTVLLDKNGSKVTVWSKFEEEVKMLSEKREYADKLITAVKKSNYPIRLEYNYASRIEAGYFKDEFWEEIPKDLVIFGYDAHSPEEIINGWNYYKDLTSHNHFVGRS